MFAIVSSINIKNLTSLNIFILFEQKIKLNKKSFVVKLKTKT